MKTLFLYEVFGEGDSCFFEVEGDYSHLDGVFVNQSGVDRSKEAELLRILFDDDGNLKVKTLKAPTKDWDHFAHVGFLP